MHSNAVAHLTDPNPGWMNSKDCGIDFSCTFPANAYVKLTGSSKTGSPQPNIPAANIFYILPNNDEIKKGFENDGSSIIQPYDSHMNGYYLESTKMG